MATGTYEYTANQTVQYGAGCTSEALPKLLKRFEAKKALIICGRSLATKTKVIQKIESILGTAHAGTFFKIGQHAPIEAVEEGLKQFQDSGADCLISVGGGSPIDSAKAMSYWSKEKSGGKFITHIAIPTTLSAAEFSGQAGFTKDGKKTGVADPALAPTAVILDAEHTLETPDKLWLGTGLRAMDHAIEALYRPYCPPLIHALAFSAIADLYKYLPISKRDPKDVQAREKLQVAAWHSLFPYRQEDDRKSALGPSHGLGYMLGAPYGIAHGQCSCLTLGPVVKFKSSRASPEEQKRLAHVLTLFGKQESGDVQRDVRSVGEVIDALVKDLGLGQGMLELGLPSKEELHKVCDGIGLKGSDKDDMMKELQCKL